MWVGGRRASHLLEEGKLLMSSGLCRLWSGDSCLKLWIVSLLRVFEWLLGHQLLNSVVVLLELRSDCFANKERESVDQ